MKKEEFKKKVLKEIANKGINITGKRVRVYKYRGEWEVRFYGEPFLSENTRRSFREDKSRREVRKDGCIIRYGLSGTFETKVSPYTHISESVFEDKEELDFALEQLRE